MKISNSLSLLATTLVLFPALALAKGPIQPQTVMEDFSEDRSTGTAAKILRPCGWCNCDLACSRATSFIQADGPFGSEASRTALAHPQRPAP